MIFAADLLSILFHDDLHQRIILKAFLSERKLLNVKEGAGNLHALYNIS